MKTLGRVLIILTAFAIVMGVTYFTVSASGSSSAGAPQFESGERPALPGGQFEGRPERNEEGGGGWMFGLMKNAIIVAVIVAVIVFPTNLMQQKRRAVPVRIK